MSKLLSDLPEDSLAAQSEYQLLEASKAGNVDIVDRILNARPELVNCRDFDGRQSTPLHFAAGYNRVRVIPLTEEIYHVFLVKHTDYSMSSLTCGSAPCIGHPAFQYSKTLCDK